MFETMIRKRIRISSCELIEGKMLPAITTGILVAVEGTVLHVGECIKSGAPIPDTSYNTASMFFNYAQFAPNGQ